MQTSTGNTSDKGTPGVPPQEDREEDSGLHDIRSMASSAKMRISSKRITTSPPVDEDILASSSAGWKAVALPEPARMVSLPEIDSLPPVEEVKSERKSKKELKAERTSASKIAKEAISVETSAAISPAPAAKPELKDVSTTPIIGARFAKPKQKSKAPLFALVGTGIAAAAGVGWYVSTQMNSSAKDSAPQQVAVSDRAEVRAQAAAEPTAANGAGSAATVTPIEPAPPVAAPEAKDTAVATGMAMDADKSAVGGADEGAAAEKSKRGNAGKGEAKKQSKKDDENKLTDKKAEPPKEAPAPKDGKKENTGGEGEPSFDALLKEAGVQDKKPVKVALEKKSLSGADIKKGMSSVAAKAQACYAGTQGTAQVKLTVNPDGSVQKVAVTGVFAGTPVGACVTSAVKGATFPAWDGGPQTFGYSYLLAE